MMAQRTSSALSDPSSGPNGLEPEYWGTIDYMAAMHRMNDAHKARAAGLCPDRFFYLEHPPIITFGRGTDPAHLSRMPHTIPALEIARGGQATYHGPGQLIGYLVINLAERSGDLRPDIHAYLRALEDGLIRFLETEYGLPARRRENFTGVWTDGIGTAGSNPGPGRKLASIGVAARRWVTLHGFALNLHPDMDHFRCIVPCGITDAEMTSVEQEYRRAGRTYVDKPMSEVCAHAHSCVLQALRDAGYCAEAVIA